jgi:hypothetical protein
MVRPLGEVLQTIGGYGFHIYDDGGARWITIRYETEDAAKEARELIAKALFAPSPRQCTVRWLSPREQAHVSSSALPPIATVPKSNDSGIA